MVDVVAYMLGKQREPHMTYKPWQLIAAVLLSTKADSSSDEAGILGDIGTMAKQGPLLWEIG